MTRWDVRCVPCEKAFWWWRGQGRRSNPLHSPLITRFAKKCRDQCPLSKGGQGGSRHLPTCTKTKSPIPLLHAPHGCRSAITALTAMPSITTLNASHQCETRKSSGAMALAAAMTKHKAIPATITGEVFGGCFLTIDLGICRLAETFCGPPPGFGEGLLLMRSQGAGGNGGHVLPLDSYKRGPSST